MNYNIYLENYIKWKGAIANAATTQLKNYSTVKLPKTPPLPRQTSPPTPPHSRANHCPGFIFIISLRFLLLIFKSLVSGWWLSGTSLLTDSWPPVEKQELHPLPHLKAQLRHQKNRFGRGGVGKGTSLAQGGFPLDCCPQSVLSSWWFLGTWCFWDFRTNAVTRSCCWLAWWQQSNGPLQRETEEKKPSSMAQISVLTSILLGFVIYRGCCCYFTLWPWLAWNALRSPGLAPNSQRLACLCLLCDGIKGVCHQAHPPLLKKDLHFMGMNAVLPACIYMQFGACPVSAEAGREGWIPWNWSYWGCEWLCGRRELNLGPQQKH